MKQLKRFQKKGVEFLLSRKTALLADDMGLGKTAQAAGVIDRLNPKRALVITLASLKINWARELHEFIGRDFREQILFKISDKVDPTADIIIVNYDLIIHKEIKKQLAQLTYEVIILDEAHNLSNMEAQRTKAIYSNHGLIRTAQRVYALTGTPVRNRPKDFYPMLKVLAPDCIEPYTDYESYATHFCGAYYETSYGNFNDKGASNIEELAERIKPFMLRRLKEDVLAELPPLIEKTIELEMTDEIQEVLNQESEMEENINEFNPNSGLGVQATVRRLLGMAKLPQVYAYVENVLKSEEKIVIFAYHTDVINSIRLHFAGYGVRAVRGGMGAKLKQTEVDLFIKDKHSRIFVGQYTAAGFGVDGLQKVASNIIFAEIDWVPGNIDQARDRVRRMGQEKPVVAHYLVTPNTLEDNMLKSVIKKGEVITKILSNTEKEEMEENDMTLETTLERIAIAQEKIAASLETMIGLAATAEIPCENCAETAAKEEAKGKKAPAKKKAAAPAEPVAPVAPATAVEVVPVVEAEVVEPAAENVDDILGVGVEAEPVKYTLDDVRVAFQQFIKKFPTQQDGTAKAKEILTKYGYANVPAIEEKDYANIITDLQKAA